MIRYGMDRSGRMWTNTHTHRGPVLPGTDMISSRYDYEPTGEGYIRVRIKNSAGPGLKLDRNRALERYYDLRNTFGATRLTELKDLQAAIELEFDYHV